MAGHDHLLEVRPKLPKALARLEDLSGNLYYSWERRVRGLFHRIDPDLWNRCEHNPKIFLRRVSQVRLKALAKSPDFLFQYKSVLDAFDSYLSAERDRPLQAISGLEPGRDLVAYFCMEYGLYESLQLYSGGLGILAGDHCKAASDLDLPFLSVGLMYRQGYFTQRLDRDGVQQMIYRPFRMEDLPVMPVTDEDGQEIQVAVELADRTVAVRVWQIRVGRLQLLLLDTDVPDNRPDDRRITYQLYGGDRVMRIEQEMVLGVGGVRALRAMGFHPSVWHINEGHPAFQILERCREWVSQGLTFPGALEAVAAATVFTTHTAVPAGHDLFARELAERYLMPLAEFLSVPLSRLLALGASPQRGDAFNMTALALRGSRRHNGVSAVHRNVAARMEAHVWPDLDPADNPIAWVSNGVHVPTFLAREWVNLFDGRYPDWRQHLGDVDFWEEAVGSIADHRFWSLTQSLKSDMLGALHGCLFRQYCRNNYPRSRIEGMEAVFSPENTRPLIIGFARRFATYKRALLIFQDIERLGRLLNDPDRPVIMLFAGKAHPQDVPGQSLIKRIHEFAARPPFLNRVFLIEGYDIALARKLVTGVDVWLNTPEYPMEASGTSGQKAAMNGVINLSVLDGWWAEGYDGDNGWAIAPHDRELSAEQRDRVEAEDLLDLLEGQVIPEYYRIGPGAYSPDWVARSKRSMISVLPHFNAEGMVRDYAQRLYAPAARHGERLTADGALEAERLAAWKARVAQCWEGVEVQWRRLPPTSILTGERLRLEVLVWLNGLESGDVVLECLLNGCDGEGDASECLVPLPHQSPAALLDERSTLVHTFLSTKDEEEEAQVFRLELESPDNGIYQLHVRLYPWHELLSHPFEMGKMLWLFETEPIED